MAKATITEEVAVLRFFETGPIEKVEAVFNIIAAKVRERRDGSGGNETGAGPVARRRQRRPRPGSAQPADSASEPARVSAA